MNTKNQNNANSEDYITVVEASKLSNMSKSFIRKHLNLNDIKGHIADNKLWLIDKDDFLNFINTIDTKKYCKKRRLKPGPKIKDLTRQRFGRLTVIKYHSTKNNMAQWLCRCDCGNERVVCGTNLRKGKSKSCGCIHRESGNRRKELTGLRFGKLVVKKFSHKNKSGVLYWLCQCDCGNKKNIRSAHLLQGRTKSCGCLKFENNKK